MQICIFAFLLPTIVTTASPDMEYDIDCPEECICLSQSQVLCNSGGLTNIPVQQLPATVERVSFTRNSFPVIPSDAFSGLKSLRSLSLEGNNITVLKPFAFRGLPRLRQLAINHTPLTRVAQFAFAGLHNLTTIDLSNNRIGIIEGYAFAGGVNLRDILFVNNPIRRIAANAFSGLTGVERLVLPSGVRELEPDAFNGLENVGYLRLGFMDLPALRGGTFRGLINVGRLSIEDSDLGIIHAGAFDGLVGVSTLNLINNKIDGIQKMHLTIEHRIEFVNFKGNHILNVPDPRSISFSTTILVRGNHFPCDCHIHDLLAGPLANSSEQFLSSNYCISPLDVNGRSIEEIHVAAIGRCEEPTMRENLEAIKNCSERTPVLSDLLLVLIIVIVSR